MRLCCVFIQLVSSLYPHLSHIGHLQLSLARLCACKWAYTHSWCISVFQSAADKLLPLSDTCILMADTCCCYPVTHRITNMKGEMQSRPISLKLSHADSKTSVFLDPWLRQLTYVINSIKHAQVTSRLRFIHRDMNQKRKKNSRQHQGLKLSGDLGKENPGMSFF